MAERRRANRFCPQVAPAAWGWRLEAGLLFSCALVLRLGDLAGPGGVVLVVGVAAVAWWRVPGIRRQLARHLERAAARRDLTRALVVAGVVGPFGPGRVGAVTPIPAGVRAWVRVPAGGHVGDLEEAAPALAAALRVREVRVTPVPANASVVTLDVLRRDPFAGPPFPWTFCEATETSLWRPVPLGVDELGRAISVSLPEHNLLMGGEPGAGKSAVLSLLVAASALDPSVTLTLLDAKRVELAPWAPCAAASVGHDTERAVEVLDGIRAEMDARYEFLLAARRRKVVATDGMGLHVVAIDELAFYLRSGTRQVREAFGEALRDLVSRGRAAGMVVVAATQKPSHDVVPTAVRDLFSYRLALRCTTPEASDTVLGQGWAAQGYSAATIDPSTRGVGLLLAEGALPVALRAAYLDDEALFAIAARAARLRGTS